MRKFLLRSLSALTAMSIFMLTALTSCQAPTSTTLTSPDKSLTAEFAIDEVSGTLGYTVTYNGQTFVNTSTLGMTMSDGEEIGANLSISSIESSLVNDTWTPTYGDRAQYIDAYSAALIKLSSNGAPALYNIEVRVYNEGVAFRYLFNEQGATIKNENSQFNIDPNSDVWSSAMSQSTISKMQLKDIKSKAERPLVGQTPTGVFFAIGEAAQINYPRTKLSYIGNALSTAIEGYAKIEDLEATPWRYIMVGDSAGELLENNFLLLNLNEPCAVEYPEQFKPGKVIRDMSLTTEGGKACIDFAVEHNLQYVIESAGWYGAEFTKEANAATITPTRSEGPFDLHEIIRYGNEKGIGILVYVNKFALDKQFDEIITLYRDWGIKGIKYGFVDSSSQRDSNWNHYMISEAAKNGMVLSIHDDLRPTGSQRTYPNWMTCEGIRGDEETPDNAHTVKTIFVRGISGPGDNTICYFADRVALMGSHASQMAKVICIYSPMTWLYWYDRPEKATAHLTANSRDDGHTSIIKEIPDLEFFDKVPTVWDETKVLGGDIDQYATIARKSGDNWFIGCVNGETPQNLSYTLDFLDADKKYTAKIFYDDASLKTETCVAIETIDVDATSTLTRKVLANNGFTVIIEPKQ